MITPERPRACVSEDAGHAVVRVPAAGHLGVIEERCPGADLHVPHGFPYEDVMVPTAATCPLCRAAL